MGRIRVESRSSCDFLLRCANFLFKKSSIGLLPCPVSTKEARSAAHPRFRSGSNGELGLCDVPRSGPADRLENRSHREQTARFAGGIA